MPSTPGNPPSPRPLPTALFWLLVVALGSGSFALRTRNPDRSYDGERFVFSDIDTMRRLARIRAIEAADRYPTVEVLDGFPEGTVSHWTRPFDWFLSALDRVVGHESLPYQAAARSSGPVLGVLMVLLFLWGAVRLLGRLPGLLAATAYSLQYPVVKMTDLGNGDHQNLQHLCLLGFGWLWVLRHAGQVGIWAAPVAGAALGMALWITTESMVIFLTYVAVTAVILLVGKESRLLSARDELLVGAGMAGVMLLGIGVEQTGFWNVEWDKISWFQLYPVLVFFAFPGLVALRPRTPTWVSAAIALAAGLVLLWAIPGFATAVDGQLAAFADVNVWLQQCVSEFRPSFWTGTEYALAPGLERFTVFFLGLPVFAVATAVTPTLTPISRLVILAATLVTAGLAAWEVKLSHLFALWTPVVIVVGGRVLVGRTLPPGPLRSAGLAAGAATWLAVCGSGIPGTALPRSTQAMQLTLEELGSAGIGNRCILAPWDFGGGLMFRRSPVVASGYHRNIDGIRDGFRVYGAQPDEQSAAREILKRRQVGFVITYFDRIFLREIPAVTGVDRTYVEVLDGQVRYTAAARRSLYWRLRYGETVPGFRLHYQSRTMVRVDGQVLPLFQVFAVQP